MLLTMGQLRQCIMAEVKKVGADTYEVNSDDIMSALNPRKFKESESRGEAVFVPLRFKSKWDKPRFAGELELYNVVSRLDISPKELLTTLKRPLVKDGITMQAPERAQAIVFGIMASQIARYFEDRVDLVTYPESSSTMARDLAHAVAQKLDLPIETVVAGMTRKKKPEELEIDPEEWENFRAAARARGKDDVYIANTRKRAENMIKRWQRGEVPAIKDIPHENRKFLALHTAGDDIHQARGKRVLVVDDNVDKTETLRRIAQELRKAGAKDVHLAAGWDYAER